MAKQRRSFRMPLSAHPEDTSAGRTLAPGETITEADLTLSGDDKAAIAHDQRLIDEVLIDLSDPPAADEPTKDDLLKRAGELDIANRSKMTADELKTAIAEVEAANAGGDS